MVLDKQALFISCSYEGDLNVWDLKEYSCLQTIKLTFPSFRIHGKLIEWGINSIYPGPKRQPPEMQRDNGGKKECFGINDIDEKKIENLNKTPSECFSVWERSCLLVACCNHLAKLRMNFDDASVEYSFTYPVLPPPPLQNSVLIPTNWGLQNYSSDVKHLEDELNINVNKQLEELSFILDKNILEEEGRKNNINYKIAILESKKEQMRLNVALGAPYLALDVYEIEELRLSDNVLKSNRKKRNFYMNRIQELLDNASAKDEIFSASSPTSSRSKSNKSSIVEFPL
ncbi:uncharacterized protein LOC143201125 [Rhynchophorus ferrugineus]|uniref:uncharacterized protein LOC143201125 n=1 Tax=Rhynchophorus ferrugineus TaxID=354439 RepID=UPI003FCE1303